MKVSTTRVLPLDAKGLMQTINNSWICVVGHSPCIQAAIGDQ